MSPGRSVGSLDGEMDLRGMGGTGDADIAGRRVIVTGGAGFIGSELVRQLDRAGARVVAVDNLINGKRENLVGVDPGVDLIVEDVRNNDAMGGLLPGADIVYHLACLGVRHSIHSPEENHHVNATATLGLLAAAREAGVRRFIYVSSSEVYGTARVVPMTEDHPAQPTTVYGASKLAGECYARAYHRTYGFSTVIVRPFNAYGPRSHHEGDSGEVIPRFMLRCMADRPMVIFGDGSQTRDFTYVQDTARGIMAAGLARGAVGETINIGSGAEIAINALSRLVAAATGRSNPSVVHEAQRPGDVHRLCADISKARRLIGFEPEVSLGQGLAELRDWYKSRGVEPERLLEEERIHNWERQIETR